MIRRREHPYSRMEAIRRSRQELIMLVGATVVLGFLLGLLSNTAFDLIKAWSLSAAQMMSAAMELLLVIALVLWLAIRFYAHGESQHVFVDIWLPYRLEPDGSFSIPIRRSYQVTVHAHRALRRRLKKEPARERELGRAWRKAREEGKPLQDVLETEYVALVQCLALYVLHRYGEEALSPKARYGWWKVALKGQRLTIEDLPPPLQENPYLLADQPPTWRLWWPEEVSWDIVPEPGNLFPRWELKHRWYGHVEIRWHPGLLGGRRGGQVWQILTERLPISEEEKREQIFLVGARMEATAHFRWAIWPGSEPFHEWATGLLAFLEEALDWDYFLAAQPGRLLADLAWKVGWMEKGTSLIDVLGEILERLERIEQAMAMLPSEEESNAPQAAR